MPLDASAEPHRPVLLKAVIERLSPQSGGRVVDATIGPGGHAREILSRLGPTGLLIGIDRDPQALEIARTRLEQVGFPFHLHSGLYTGIRQFCKLSGFSPEGALDGVLLDLGVSSLQLDRPERGFSFLRDGPLDMRMSPGEGMSAAEYLQRVSVEELQRALREYGEEPAAAKVARAIDRAGAKEPIESTLRLQRVVEDAIPRRGRRIHPATRTFQAIRIAVNGELENLRLVLRGLDRLVKPGGRVVVLSYHSLEDRIVKSTFREEVREGLWEWILPNPLLPDADEIAANPRSRSARLRAVVRAGAG